MASFGSVTYGSISCQASLDVNLARFCCEQGRWLNQDSLWWTSPFEVSASRKGLDNLYDPRLEDLSEQRLAGYAAATRPPRMSQTNQNVSGFGFILSKTNLLKSVKRPLGALITLDYTRVGNT